MYIYIYTCIWLYIPGTRNNQFKVDVWWQRYFLRKELESSNWNNRLSMVVWGSRYMYVHYIIYIRILDLDRIWQYFQVTYLFFKAWLSCSHSKRGYHVVDDSSLNICQRPSWSYQKATSCLFPLRYTSSVLLKIFIYFFHCQSILPLFYG